jgi:hypothetical protein
MKTEKPFGTCDAKKLLLWALGMVIGCIVVVGAFLKIVGKDRYSEEEARELFQDMMYRAEERLPVVFATEKTFRTWKMTDAKYDVYEIPSRDSPLVGNLSIAWVHSENERDVSARVKFLYAFQNGEWNLLLRKLDITVTDIKTGGRSLSDRVKDRYPDTFSDLARQRFDEIDYEAQKARWAVVFRDSWIHGLENTEIGNILCPTLWDEGGTGGLGERLERLKR